MRLSTLPLAVLGTATVLSMAVVAFLPAGWETWLGLGIIIGVTAVALVVVQGRAAESGESILQRRGVPMLGLLPLFLGAMLVVSAIDPTLAQQEVLREAEDHAQVVADWEHIIDEQGYQLQQLQALFESAHITSGAFANFVEGSGWEFGPGHSTALGYAPIVAAEDREAFEAATRSDEELPEAVRSDFAIFPEHDADFYVPVRMVYPLDPEPGAIGFDLNVDPPRQDALLESARTGFPAASAPTEIVKPDGNEWGMMVAMPVEKNGIVVGYVISAHAVADASVAPAPPDDTEYRIVDVTEDDHVVLYQSNDAEWSTTSTISAWGRTWHVDSASKSTLHIAEFLTPIAIMGATGILSLAVTGITIAYQSTRERAIRLSHDMIAQARNEESQRAKIEQMKELDSFRARFINMATHELRTPLTPINAQLYILRQKFADSEEVSRSMDILERSVDRVNRMLNDMLLAAKADAGSLELKREPTDLAQVAIQSVEAHLDAAKAVGTELALDVAPAWVTVDRLRMDEVLDNMLSNSLKFTEGGIIHVSVHPTDDGAELQVKDNGRGIAPERLEELGQPFAQAHSDSGGTGLGLYICRLLVELHGGSLELASDGEGTGTTVTVRLPSDGEKPSPNIPPGDHAP